MSKRTYKTTFIPSVGIDGNAYWREYTQHDGRLYLNTPEVLNNRQLARRERQLRPARKGRVVTAYRYYA